MKTIKYALTFVLLIISLNTIAQYESPKRRSDSVKRFNGGIYKVKLKNNELIKGEPTRFYEHHSIQYSNNDLYGFYNSRGLLIGHEYTSDLDSIFYSENEQIIKHISYKEKSTPFRAVNYYYDQQGNIKDIIYESFNSEKDSVFCSDYDKHYLNYYLSANDSVICNEYEKIILKLNINYRLFDEQNNLIAEKILTTSRNPLSNVPESILYSVKYEYNNDNQVSAILSTNEHLPKRGKNYTTKSSEYYSYNKKGQIQAIDHFKGDSLSFKQEYVYDAEGIPNEYKEIWLKSENSEWFSKRFLLNSDGFPTAFIHTRKEKTKSLKVDYTHNERGHWTRCIHYNHKNKPMYWVEREIEYY